MYFRVNHTYDYKLLHICNKIKKEDLESDLIKVWIVFCLFYVEFLENWIRIQDEISVGQFPKKFWILRGYETKGTSF